VETLISPPRPCLRWPSSLAVKKHSVVVCCRRSCSCSCAPLAPSHDCFSFRKCRRDHESGLRLFDFSVAIGGTALFCAWPFILPFFFVCVTRDDYCTHGYEFSFTPARAVYLVIILCVLSWCTGHQSVDDIVSFCYDLIYVIIYHARVIILIVIYLNILCVVRSSRGSVNIRRFRSKLAVFEGG